MKLHSLIPAAILIVFAFAAYACGQGHSHDKSGDKQEQSVDRSGPEYTSAYICPMNCAGSGSDKAGVCPVCGMDYVANKNFKGDDHDHDHDHEGHDHEH